MPDVAGIMDQSWIRLHRHRRTAAVALLCGRHSVVIAVLPRKLQAILARPTVGGLSACRLSLSGGVGFLGVMPAVAENVAGA